ncbi:MAG: hypothetical protein OXH70_07965 [Acidobacteria bacterium]|nr:hypothetical protein [Acidobacteriota bacterium]
MSEAGTAEYESPGIGRAVATAGALWAVGGIVGLLVWAVYRLARISMAAFDHPFAWYHWASLLAIIPFMAWSEGLRGFQLRFSPRVAERAMAVRSQPTLLRVVLAPLYAAGYFEGTRRERLGVWFGTVGILVLIVLVHRLDQPWRGILDAGVVVGLSWGTIATLALTVRAWRSQRGRRSRKPALRAGCRRGRRRTQSLPR